MLAEIYRYLTTPCPAHLKEMGFLKSLVALETRYHRRKKAWRPHIENSRAIIEDAVTECGGGRLAIVVGSGLLLEVPLRILSEKFDKVLLVDLIHLAPARSLARHYENLEFAIADVSEVLLPVHEFAKGGGTRGQELPDSRPTVFSDANPDLVISANLLSQLPILPRRYLEKMRPTLKTADLDRFCRRLIENHLSWLAEFSCPVSLITDRVRVCRDGSDIYDTEDILWGVDLPYAGREWTWDIAPRPELSRKFDVECQVLGVTNLKTAKT